MRVVSAVNFSGAPDIDRPAHSAELKLPPLERPVLYQRGLPEEDP